MWRFTSFRRAGDPFPSKKGNNDTTYRDEVGQVRADVVL